MVKSASKVAKAPKMDKFDSKKLEGGKKDLKADKKEAKLMSKPVPKPAKKK